MNTVVTIDGVSYTAAQRAEAGLRLDEVSLSLGGYGTLAFHEFHKSPFPTWPDLKVVTLAADGTTYFSGFITECQSGQDEDGWSHAYTVMGVRWAVDKYVPIEAADGTGVVVYNRSPEDPYGADSDRGLSLGTILTRVLTVPATAARLNALGVGGYTSLTPPTLPSATVADLAKLTVVPRQPVVLQGKGILSIIDQQLSRWMPKFVCELRPDGAVRFRDTTDMTDFVPATVTLPSMFGTGDPIPHFPSVRRSSADVANRYVFRGGPEVEAAMLSEVDGTLAKGFTSTDITNWTYAEFTKPKGASDHGTITAMTSTSATLQSSDGTVAWVANFWSDRNAALFMTNTVAAGINEMEYRLATSNTAMSAGGTATVSWDAAWPTQQGNYTSYRIAGQSKGLVDTWRLYLVREPATGNTGTNTYIGSRLVRKSPKEVKWANASTSFGAFYTQAVVVGAHKESFPVQVEPVPSLGGFRFVKPTVAVFSQASKLAKGSPTTAADGLPTDVQILALYSRGAMTAVVPADVAGVPQYSGTAATAGIHVTEYLDFPTWTWKNDAADMVALATQHLQSTQDIVYDVSFDWAVGASGAVPSWPFLQFTTAVNIAVAGSTSPWSAINAPVRSVKLRWTAGPRNAAIQSLSFTASNKRKAFTGDDMYVHPAFAGGTVIGGFNGEGGVGGSGYIPAGGPTAAQEALANGANFGSNALAASTAAARNIPTDPGQFVPSRSDFAGFGVDISGKGGEAGNNFRSSRGSGGGSSPAPANQETGWEGVGSIGAAGENTVVDAGPTGWEGVGDIGKAGG